MTEPHFTDLGFDDDTDDADQGKLLVLRGHGLRLVFPAGVQLTPQVIVSAAVAQAAADAVHGHQTALRKLLGFDLAGHGAVRRAG